MWSAPNDLRAAAFHDIVLHRGAIYLPILVGLGTSFKKKGKGERGKGEWGKEEMGKRGKGKRGKKKRRKEEKEERKKGKR